jgi:hypothetical protein
MACRIEMAMHALSEWLDAAFLLLIRQQELAVL